MLWTSLGCLIFFVNSVVWNDNVINWAPVWCDISSRYIIGASVGIPASSLCIIRRLYYMTKLQTISIGKAERRREIAVDVSIGIVFPCVVIALEYIVQPHRFVIYEQIGCYPFTANILATYFLVLMWPLVIGLISIIYAALTFRRAFLQKEQLKKMHHAGFSISAGRYYRLMALCSMEIIFTVPMNLYLIIVNAIVSHPGPYVSWAWMHADISQIYQYPIVIWQSVPELALPLEISRWLLILCAFVIFAFFGWAQEARSFYCQAFWSVNRRLGRYSKPSSPSLPTTFTFSKRFTYAGKPSFPVHDADQQMRLKYLSMPVQARVRHHSFRSSLSLEAPSCSESLSSNSRLGVDKGSTENPPKLPSLSGLERHTRISWTSMPAVPEPALATDRRSLDFDPGRRSTSLTFCLANQLFHSSPQPSFSAPVVLKAIPLLSLIHVLRVALLHYLTFAFFRARQYCISLMSIQNCIIT
ncbi:pheromone A receptor-domain-containing protein [Butyriboletus roseoflavus]|nr:pheromone A receptor-domain-containing protein [Butyriboletus roseoflavus]